MVASPPMLARTRIYSSMDEVFGHRAAPGVAAMYERIGELTRRPVRFTTLSPRMQQLGTQAGCEIWEDEITIAVIPGEVNDYSLAHEMAHVIIELESPYLALGDGIPRGHQDRKVLGLLISCFEHSNVYEMVRGYGIDTSTIENRNVLDFLTAVKSITTRPLPPFFFQNYSIGYADLRRLSPSHTAWAKITSELGRRHKLTLDQALSIESAMSDARVSRRQFRAMFADVANAWQLGLEWRAQVVDRPAAGEAASRST